jgi:hypothetical protein
MNLVIVFVLNMDSLDFLIVILNLCILWINLDLQIFIKSNGVYSSLFWINVGISRPSRRTWWLLLTLKYKDNRCSHQVQLWLMQCQACKIDHALYTSVLAYNNIMPTSKMLQSRTTT